MEKTMFDVAQVLSTLSQNVSFDKNDTSILISGDYSVPESGVVGLLSFAAKAFGKGDLLAGAIRAGDGNWSGSYNIQLRNVGSLIEKAYPLLRDKHLIDRSEAKEDANFNGQIQNLTEELDKANAKQVTSAVTLYEADQGALPVVAAETNTNAAYNQVVQLLITNKYLKKEADEDYSAKAKNKVFVYDKDEGVVSVADKE